MSDGTASILRWVFVGLLVLVVVPDFVIHQHEHFGIEATFGFYAWFGFGASIVTILVARGLQLLLGRPDEYYDD